MKKFKFLFALMVSGTMLFGQPIVDNAVIPVSVTLNSILRLNVTSGGNIEFVVTTLSQYESGINSAGTDTRYITTFTVASSVDFNVAISSETADLAGTSGAAGNVMAMNNLGYSLDYTGTGGTAADDGSGHWDLDPNIDAAAPAEDPAVLTVLGATCVTSSDVAGGGLGGAGDTEKNQFDIIWRLGTSTGGNMSATNLLQNSIAPDRYATNVYLSLVEQP
jgi:hypothetical protein